MVYFGEANGKSESNVGKGNFVFVFREAAIYTARTATTTTTIPTTTVTKYPDRHKSPSQT